MTPHTEMRRPLPMDMLLLLLLRLQTIDASVASDEQTRHPATVTERVEAMTRQSGGGGVPRTSAHQGVSKIDTWGIKSRVISGEEMKEIGVNPAFHSVSACVHSEVIIVEKRRAGLCVLSIQLIRCVQF